MSKVREMADWWINEHTVNGAAPKINNTPRAIFIIKEDKRWKAYDDRNVIREMLIKFPSESIIEAKPALDTIYVLSMLVYQQE